MFGLVCNWIELQHFNWFLAYLFIVSVKINYSNINSKANLRELRQFAYESLKKGFL